MILNKINQSKTNAAHCYYVMSMKKCIATCSICFFMDARNTFFDLVFTSDVHLQDMKARGSQIFQFLGSFAITIQASSKDNHTEICQVFGQQMSKPCKNINNNNYDNLYGALTWPYHYKGALR